jgi:hypothetical protein
MVKPIDLTIQETAGSDQTPISEQGKDCVMPIFAIRSTPTTNHRSGVRRRLGAALASAFAAAALLGAAAGPAAAATGESGASASGRLILFQNPDFTRPTDIIDYSACRLVRQVSGSVASFDNRPPSGCQVTLQNRSGMTMRLCAGRDVIPLSFRQSPTVRVQAGLSLPCR